MCCKQSICTNCYIGIVGSESSKDCSCSFCGNARFDVTYSPSQSQTTPPKTPNNTPRQTPETPKRTTPEVVVASVSDRKDLESKIRTQHESESLRRYSDTIAMQRRVLSHSRSSNNNNTNTSGSTNNNNNRRQTSYNQRSRYNSYDEDLLDDDSDPNSPSTSYPYRIPHRSTSASASASASASSASAGGSTGGRPALRRENRSDEEYDPLRDLLMSFSSARSRSNNPHSPSGSSLSHRINSSYSNNPAPNTGDTGSAVNNEMVDDAALNDVARLEEFMLMEVIFLLLIPFTFRIFCVHVLCLML